MSGKQLLSIVCPVYNEQDNILPFYDRFLEVVQTLEQSYEFELIFTNNRSTDDTPAIILQLHEQNPKVKLLTFARNFGYQASILGGLTFAQGDATVVIDVDCEDPPEMIRDFVKYWEEGYDVVYGIRAKREESEVMQALRRLFYRILRVMADSDVILNMAEFALITRVVRDAIINNKSTFPFLRTEIGYAGFKRIGLPYIRQARQHGKTHYNFLGMAAFAIGGILSSSTFLLRLSAYIGALLLPLNLVLLGLDLANVSDKAFTVSVFLDLMYLVFFLAVLSTYNARIYKNGVQRPVFIVDWKLSTYESAPVHTSLSEKGTN